MVECTNSLNLRHHGNNMAVTALHLQSCVLHMHTQVYVTVIVLLSTLLGMLEHARDCSSWLVVLRNTILGVGVEKHRFGAAGRLQVISAGPSAASTKHGFGEAVSSLGCCGARAPPACPPQAFNSPPSTVARHQQHHQALLPLPQQPIELVTAQ